MHPTICPSPDELAAFAVGRLAEQSGERIGDHVETCPACEAAMESLEPTADSFIGALRHPAEWEEALAEPGYERALARAVNIGREAADPARGETVTLAGRETSRAGEVPPGDQDVPPQGPADAAGMPGGGRLRDYQLLEPIGRGGMGTVWKALHTKLDAVVALKVLPEKRMADEQAVARFEREMKAVGKLRHPNIVQAHDAGEENGVHYLVMEYVEGIDIEKLVEQVRPLPIADACELVRQAAIGLQYAHENGRVHRDIKPSNLMLTSDGQVKVLDLGLALLQADRLEDAGLPRESSASEDGLTMDGELMGTLDYMAPEQASDTHGVDIRADVYSLGCTLYKLLTGKAPFSGPDYETPVQKLKAHEAASPPPIQEARPDAPEELVKLLGQLLAKNPDDRPATPGEVADMLSPFSTEVDLGALYRRGTGDPVQPSGQGPPHSAADARHRRPFSRPHKTSPAPLRRFIPRRSRTFIALAALGAVALGAIITIATNRGTLEIKTYDQDVKVIVRQDGELVDIIDTRTKQSVRLWAGKYEVALGEGAEGLRLSADRFELHRGGEVVVEVGPPGALGETIDLLKLIQPKRDAVRGRWLLDDGTLWALPTKGSSLLTIPYDPPEEYAMTVVVERLGGNGSFMCLLRVGDARVEACIDEYPGWGSISGLSLVDGREAVHNATARKGPLLTNHEQHRVVYTVRKNEVLIECDHRAITRWKGDPSHLSPRGWSTSVPKAALGILFCDPPFRIHKLSLVPLSGRGQAVATVDGAAQTESNVDLESPTTQDTAITASGVASPQAALSSRESLVRPVPQAELDRMRSKQTATSSSAPAGATDRQAAQWVLNLGGKVTISAKEEEATIDSLARLPKEDFSVTDVRLRSNKDVTDASLKHLNGLTELRSLDLVATRIVTLEHLPELPGLKELWLDSSPISDHGLQYLGNFKGLRRLGLNWTHVTDVGLKYASELPRLQNLQLNNTRISDRGTKYLERLAGLNTLWISDTEVTDSGLHSLALLTELRDLRLGRLPITDEGLASLESLDKIGILYLSGTAVTDAGLKHLAGMRGLWDLYIGESEVTGTGLKHLAGCALSRLWASDSQFSDEGLRELRLFPALYELHVSGTKVTDEGMPNLTALKKLSRLGLARCQITDDTVAHFSKLPKLRALGLEGCPITDAAIDDLKKLDLIELDIRGTKISAGGVRELREALPGCTIKHQSTE